MNVSDSSSVVAPAWAVDDAVRAVTALVCAASAGLHLALVPAHYHEAGLLLAAAFAVSAVLLGVSALLLRRAPGRGWTDLLPPLALAGVAACYVLSRTTGIPLLIPAPEENDLLGSVTTIAEVTAAAAAVWPLLHRKENR